MASENVQTAPNPTAPSVEFSYAFENSENLQIIALSNKDMKDIQGAVAPWVIYNGLTYGQPASIAAQRWATGPGPQITFANFAVFVIKVKCLELYARYLYMIDFEIEI